MACIVSLYNAKLNDPTEIEKKNYEDECHEKTKFIANKTENIARVA
jgi:hypothetical protein